MFYLCNVWLTVEGLRPGGMGQSAKCGHVLRDRLSPPQVREHPS